ncbi:MAG: amidohydrolase family protein [Rhizobiales bacterium]|nr:amidohydrolase family protein [Hyphomicrobiales bacterium]
MAKGGIKRTIQRRQFLSGAGAAGAAAGAVAVVRPAQGQPARVSATPAMAVADAVLRNGKIITIDAASTVTDAIAVSNDKIIAVGPNDAMAAHIGPSTRVIDLKGKAVIPGITDGHAHMDREGLRNVFLSLGRVRSIRDIQDRIAELARGKRPGEWIVTMPIGDPPYYFDVPEILAEKRWPTRQELDQAAPNNPVYIRSIWGFWRGTLPLVSCANTEALKRAGVTRDTASPVKSLTIEKDANGDPTGVFIEQEMQPITELVWFREATRFSHTDRMKALQESQRLYHAVGTTGVFEGHGAAGELIRVYKQTHQDGALSMRTTLAFSPDWLAAGNAPLGPFVDAWAAWLGEPAIGDDRLRMSGVYLSLGQAPAASVRSTAAGSYTGWAGFNYTSGLPRQKLKEVLVRCAVNDIRVVMNGPPVLDLYDEVDREVPLKGKRWVIAHINDFSARDVERIVRMGLVLTTHTNNYLYKGLHVHAKRLPPERHAEIVPLRSLLDAGVKVSLATDNVPITNFLPISHTILRTSYVTKQRIAPKQVLTRMEALRCATADGAYLTFDENKRGSLQTGKYADLAVLSADPLTVEESRIEGIASLMTMVGGRIVHEVPNWAG